MKSLKVYARFIGMKTAKRTKELKDYGHTFVDVILLGPFCVLAVLTAWIVISTIVLLLLPVVLLYLLFIYLPFKPRKKNNPKKIWIKFFLKNELCCYIVRFLFIIKFYLILHKLYLYQFY